VALKRVLVIRLSAIGDVALAVPLLQNACTANAHIEFYFLCKPFAKQILPNISNLIIIEWHTEQQSFWAIANIVRKLKFDAIIDLHAVLRTHLLRAALPFHKWFVFDKARAAKQYYLKNKSVAVSHTLTRYSQAFVHAGINLDTDFKHQPLALSNTIVTLFAQALSAGQTLIGIAPFAAHVQKSLPLPFLTKIIETLSHKIVLFGGPNDKQIILDLCSKHPRVQHCLELNFREQIQLMKHLQVMIAVDSANMHLAALQGVPLISIWGATHQDLGFGPVTSAAHIAIHKSFTEMPCRPCSVFGNKPCNNEENMACFNRIDIGEILEAVDSLILKHKIQ
jgi:ADP-heptose:LPS heptosyltransferase